jgi:hypothetical protein
VSHAALFYAAGILYVRSPGPRQRSWAPRDRRARRSHGCTKGHSDWSRAPPCASAQQDACDGHPPGLTGRCVQPMETIGTQSQRRPAHAPKQQCNDRYANEQPKHDLHDRGRPAEGLACEWSGQPRRECPCGIIACATRTHALVHASHCTQANLCALRHPLHPHARACARAHTRARAHKHRRHIQPPYRTSCAAFGSCAPVPTAQHSFQPRTGRTAAVQSDQHELHVTRIRLGARRWWSRRGRCLLGSSRPLGRDAEAQRN